MPKALFDNIMKVIRLSNTISGTTVISVEVDFELPRGYVAKIKKVIMELQNWQAVWGAAEQNSIIGALIKDPDDSSTTDFTSNTTEHDVIASHQIDFSAITGAAGQFQWASDGFRKIIEFDEGLDVITARNMRWNSNSDGAELDNATHRCQIYYTLEKVSDDEIIDLLDIL